MPRLVFDVRANHDTGVSRYGLSLLAPAAGELVEAGWRIDVVVNPDQADRARRAVDGPERQAEVHVAAEDGGFVRSSHYVRALASRADLYYTSHYLLDRLCPVPFVVTIHDVTRLRWPHLSYTDASFAARFGRTELDTVRRELAALDRWQNQRFAGHGAFTRYFAAVNQFLITRAERVLTVSHSTADELGRCLGPPSGGITIVPGGVDTAVFHRRSTTEVDAVRYLLR
ncbi:MAG: glycosyltransferase, partial [Pseudonocardiaceae bacterium]